MKKIGVFKLSYLKVTKRADLPCELWERSGNEVRTKWERSGNEVRTVRFFFDVPEA
jgi:hypothetical protein